MQDASSSPTLHDELPDDPLALRAIVNQQRQLLIEQQQLVAAKVQLVAEQVALLDAQRDAILALEQQRDEWRTQCEAYKLWVEKLNRARYGRGSERDDPRQRLLQFPDDPAEALALAEALDEAADAARDALEERTPAPRKKRRQGAFAAGEFPAHWPRIEETIDPPPSDLSCPTHGPKQLIGYDQTQTLELVPPQMRVRVRRYAKYACEKQPECGVAQAPRVPALVQGNHYDISVAVAVMLWKYAYHLPLYRQQDLFAAGGWTPSRSTLQNLLEACDGLLVPFVDFVRGQVLAGGAIGTDDTRITLITPPFAPPLDDTNSRSARTHEVLADAITAGDPSITARMWAYYSLTAPLNYFDFTVSRHRDGPADVLMDFQGTLLGDSYSGYESIVLDSAARISRAACWAHARRKFEELQTHHPLEAARMLALVRMLYDVEDRARGLSPEDRRALREAEARPVLEKIREFLWSATYEQKADLLRRAKAKILGDRQKRAARRKPPSAR